MDFFADPSFLLHWNVNPSTPYSLCSWTQDAMIVNSLSPLLTLGYPVHQWFYSLPPYTITFPLFWKSSCKEFKNRHEDVWGHSKHQNCPIIWSGIFWSSMMPLPWIKFSSTCVYLGTFLVFLTSTLSCKSSCKQSKVIKYIWMYGDTPDIGPVPSYFQISTDPSWWFYLCPCTVNSVLNHCTYQMRTNRQPYRENHELGDCDSYFSFFCLGLI